MVSAGRNKWGDSLWVCQCDCGGITTAAGGSLRQRRTRSCSCLSKEILVRNRRIHGMTDTKIYNIWTSMKSRCQNKNHPFYKDYGARGIIIEWKSFEEFKKDMHSAYSKHVSEYGIKNTSLDRIDNNGPYSKENCRWATSSQQGKNKRNNVLLSFGGETKCMSAWEQSLGLRRGSLWERLNRNKWSIEKALTQ